MLLELIKKELLEARKESIKGKPESKALAKIQASLLTTIIGESQTDGKDPTDSELMATIQKFANNIQNNLKLRKDEKMVIELNFITSYTPYITKEVAMDILEGSTLSKKDKINLVKDYCKANATLFDSTLIRFI